MRGLISIHKISVFLILHFAVFFSFCKSKKNTTSNTENDGGKSTITQNRKPKNLSTEDEFKFKNTFFNACKEKIKGNIEIAENLFKDCLKINPQNATAKFELAGIYKFSGLYDQALKYSKEASLTDPKNEWYQLLYIDCLHNKRLYTEAAENFEVLIKKFPGRIDFYQETATEYIYAGKYDKAIKAYDDMEKKFGRSPEASLGKVKLYKQTKKWTEAEIELKKLIIENPKEAQYYTFLADLYQENNQSEKAFQTYQEILKTDPENPYIHLALADYYRAQKKDEEFFKEVKIAFSSEDLDINNKVKILDSYFHLTDQLPLYKAQAYELCEILVKVNAKDPKAHSIYADFLYRDKKTLEAKVELEKVIEIDKSNFSVWKHLLACDSELNDFESLQKHSSEAIDLFPNQPLPFFLNGIANLRLKKYKEAIEALKDGQEFVYEDEP
ncbi:MAG TPA: tetratricopeptide repeat protein, partial [Nitrosopumilaceae archaeon]|nr:tetratricopeptide repeat protein [Nitrosopumilaceae archaeon]